MSDLQLGLVALGAIVIATVILYNWWQERRFSRESIRRFEGPVDDVLLEEFRINTDAVVTIEREEVFAIESESETMVSSDRHVLLEYEESPRGEPDEPPAAFEGLGTEPLEETGEESVPWEADPADQELEEFFNADSQQPEPVAETPASPQPALQPQTAVAAEAALPGGVDEQIDLVGMIYLDLPRSGATLREELQPLPDFDKPTQWLGLDEDGIWRHLTKDQEAARFSRMACILQLADRSGPVSRDTLRNFQIKVDDVAAKLGARVEWQGHADPHRYAEELDQFCVEVDVMVGFHVIQGASGPFTGTKLRGLAEAGGMKLGEDGNFHCRSETGDTLFMLINQDQRPFSAEALRTAFIRGVSFQLDVPRVKNCTEAFNQMALLGRQMESSLSGRLVDDNQRLLGDAEIEQIRQQLRIIYSRMVARGVIPGSATANRLFS